MARIGGWVSNDWFDDPTPLSGSVSLLRETADQPLPKKKAKRRVIGFTLPKPKKKKLRYR